MKTPEEIKKGLECCASLDEKECEACPYKPDRVCGETKNGDALAYIRQLESAQPKWISVEERLPQENEYVLIFADSVQVARLIKGITEEERALMRNGEIENQPVSCWDSERGMCSIPRSELYGPSDVFGNNKVPYYWKANGGPMSWFGQEVTHWMPLPEPPKEEEQ